MSESPGPGHEAPSTIGTDERARTGAETSLAYLQGLLNHGGAVMYVRDAVDSRFIMVNQGFEDLIGLPADQIVGRTGFDIFPAEIAAEHRANDLQILSDGVPRTIRETAPQRDGTLREYVSRKFALLTPDGTPYAIGGVSTDVTDLESERRATLDARHESEARFRAVFTHAPIGQIFSEIGGRVSDVNAPLATMLGYAPSEMVGMNVADFTDPDEMDKIRDVTRELMAGTSLTVSAIRRFRHRDGRRIPVRVTSALLRGAAGEPRWWVSLVADISEEEAARTELERAHRAAVRGAQRLQLMHTIAATANESLMIERAAPEVLREVSDHFGWPAAALLHFPPVVDDGDSAATPATVAACWLRPGSIEPADTATLARIALGLVPRIELDQVREPVQLIATRCAESGIAGSAVVLPLTEGGDTRYAWCFLRGSDIGAEEDIDGDAYEVLSLIGLETSRVVERQAAQQAVLDSERRFRSIFAGSPLPMALSIGSNGTFSEVNEAFCLMLGRRSRELTNRPAADFTHPEDVHLLDAAGEAALKASDRRHRFEARMLHSSGAEVITDITLTWMSAGDGSLLLLAQMENITARRRAEDSLRRQADEDSLTGLANRFYLTRRLRAHAGRDLDYAVLFIDLDGFKLINDSRGHEVGDEVLVEVGRRLRSALRPDDVAARFGGDEFVALCRGDVDEHEAMTIAYRIEQSLAEPIPTRSGIVRVTASVGIACGRISAEHPTELLQRADAAMYHAKRLGKDRSELYDRRLHEQSLSNQRTEAALRNALDEDRFVLHYQPIVDLVDHRIVGFEALVRLLDEAGKLVPPHDFISVAEETGLVVPMGTWVLQEACRTIAELRRTTGLPLSVSVNVSPNQAARSDLSEVVSSALAGAELHESALCIELTESALLEADDSTLLQLNDLRARGIQIALDDFGTGYSSLSYLRNFPVSHLKVDRSFVAGIGVRKGDLAIVRAVTGLARDLGIGCVAEGIETSAQLSEVTALGARFGQGYLFSRPVPASELSSMLERDRTAAARGA